MHTIDCEISTQLPYHKSGSLLQNMILNKYIRDFRDRLHFFLNTGSCESVNLHPTNLKDINRV